MRTSQLRMEVQNHLVMDAGMYAEDRRSRISRFHMLPVAVGEAESLGISFGLRL